jgi:hypothetical protein
MNDSAAMKASAILNTASELVIAILPVLAVFRLQVDPRQRWTVIGLLSLGFLVTLAGCLRTYTIWRTVQSYDLAWWSTPHWICSEVEIDLALVCAIIPALPLAHACSFFFWLTKPVRASVDLRMCGSFTPYIWARHSSNKRLTTKQADREAETARAQYSRHQLVPNCQVCS